MDEAIILEDACNFSVSLASQTPESCPGAQDGALDVSVSGATGTTTYAWSGPSGFSANTEDVSGLAAGQYTVVVTDGSSCSETVTFNVAAGPDVTPPIFLNLPPAYDTLECKDGIPADPVTAVDACGPVTLIPTQSVSAYNCSPGLVAWWPAEGNGNDAQSNLNASLINGTTFSTGIAGDAFQLDGVDDYLAVTDTVTYSANSYSNAFWIKTSGTSAQTIFSASDVNTGNPRINIRMTPTGQFQFFHEAPQDVTGGTTITTTNTFNDGQWHQLIVQKVDSVMSIRVDNTPQISGIDTNNFVNEPLLITIGRLSYLNFASNENFSGQLDEVRVYSRALCEEETQALYLAGQNGVWAPTFRLTRTWNAFDQAGNFASATQEIIFDDQTDPILVPPAPITISCSDPNGVPRSNSQIRDWLNSASGTDSCSCVILSYTAPPVFPSACNGFSTLITFTVTDECGNLTTASSTVTVIDTTAPSVSCPSDIVVGNDPGVCAAVVNFNVQASDLCGTVDLALSDSSGSSFPLGTHTVFATGTDECGYTDTCSFNITVEDQTSPVFTGCPSNMVLPSCNSLATWTPPTATDLCSGPATVTGTHAPGITLANGSATVTYTATDAVGNQSTCSFTVSINDNTPPLAVCQDATVQLDANGTASITASTLDNGSADDCSPITLSLGQANFSCADLGVTPVVLTVTDANGNAANCTADVTVGNAVSPTLVCPAAMNVACSSDIPAPDVNSVTATSNCGGLTVFHLGDSNNSGSGCANDAMVVTRTYQVADQAGNNANCVQVITVKDETGPAITCPADIVINCNQSSAVPATGMATATDNCANPTSATRSFNLSELDGNESIDFCGPFLPCFGVQPAWGTATITDNGGNYTLDVVVDQFWRIESYAVKVGSAAGEYSFDPSGNPVVDGSWTNVDLSSSLPNTVSESFSIPAGSCGILGLELKVAKLNALSGVDPLSRQTLYLSNGGFANDPITNPSAFLVGFCPQPAVGGPVMSMSDSFTGSCGSSGVLSRTFSATDDCGNTSNCVQTITMVDNQAPTANCPADMVVDSDPGVCGAVVNFNMAASDDCGSATVNSSLASGSVFPVGTTPVTLNAVDACGNAGDCTFNITVNDNEAPSIVCPPNAVVVLDANCSYTLADYTNDPWLTYTDNCAIVSIDQSPLAGSSVNGVGSEMVTLTVADAAGNTAVCTFDILANDTLAPVAVCQDITIQLDANGAGTVSAADIDGGSYDNCGIDSISIACTEICQTVDFNTDGNGQALSAGTNLTTQLAGYGISLVSAQGGIGQAWIFDSSNPTSDPDLGTPNAQYGGPGQGNAGASNNTALGNLLIVQENTSGNPDDNAGGGTLSLAFDNPVSLNSLTLVDIEEGSGFVQLTTTNGPVTLPIPASGNNSVQTLAVNTSGVTAMDIVLTGSGALADLNFCSGGCNTSFTCADIGVNQVELTVVDVNGNTATCSAQVTVEGSSTVEIVCPADLTVACDGNNGAYVNWTAPTATAQGSCSGNGCSGDPQIAGFIYLGEHNGHRYYCSTTNLNWMDARDAAVAAGGYLATIDNAAENAFLHPMLAANVAWIGFNDMATEGTFAWVNGDPVGYTNWRTSTDPNNAGGNCNSSGAIGQADFTVIHKNDGKWLDRRGCMAYEFIMEVPCGSGATVSQIAGPSSGDFFPVGTTEVVYVATDVAGNADTCSFNVTVEECAIEYCAASGCNTQYEWIDAVSLVNLNNVSGNDQGYGDYTHLSENLVAGSQASINLDPGFSGQSYREYWKVWIDWNRDGDFYDAGERIFYGNGNGNLSGTFQVPANAATGDLRMRVMMQWNCYPAGPCCSIQYGEVEDYTIQVSGSGARVATQTLPEPVEVVMGEEGNLNPGSGIEFTQVYPNPSLKAMAQEVSVDFRTGVEGKAVIQVVDLYGRTAWSQTKETTIGNNRVAIPTAQLATGSYLIQVSSEQGRATYKLVVQ